MRFSFGSGRWLLVLAITALGAVCAYELLPESRTRDACETTLRPHASEVSLGISCLKRLTVLHVNGEEWWGVDDHHIFYSGDGGHRFERRGALPKVSDSAWEHVNNWVARTKMVRLLRQNRGPEIATVLRTGTLLVFFDHLYRSDDGGFTFRPVLRFDDSQHPPAFPSGVAVGPDNTVYFGEYLTTQRPNRVRVFGSRDDGRSWFVAHEFAVGQVFHIHGVQYDQYRRGYWVMTGDRDEEANVFFTGDNFRSLKRLGGGSQAWRVISLKITPDSLHWGSDDDINGADIFRWDFASERLERIAHIGPPAYYSVRLAAGTKVLSTAFEPVSPYSRHANPAPRTDVWVSRDGQQWTKVLSADARPYTGDGWPHRGQLRMPSHPFDSAPGQLILTPIHTVPERHRTYVIGLQ